MPSFAAMTELMDRAETLGTPLLHGFEGRAEDARTGPRYQRQLCLEMSELARRFGPQVVDRVAITGGDPFLRTGSDIAVTFAAKQPALLNAFHAQKLAAAVKQGATAVEGAIGGVAYAGAVTVDRSVCSYLATLTGANGAQVSVVTNSLVQLGRLAAVAGGAPALAASDEFRFFRDRYVLGADGELGLIVITDAAIRRWCSPAWRIGEARRTRALAMLTELHADQAPTIGAGKIPSLDAAGAVAQTANLDPPGLGVLAAGPMGLRSSIYGSLGFATPLAELALARCSTAEAEAYRGWRQRYQANWRQFFDPIALRIVRTHNIISLDLTVMPLIAGSDYRGLIQTVGGATLKPGAGDPHAEALWQVYIALDPKSEPVREMAGFMRPYGQQLADPLGWLGGSLSWWADASPFWDEWVAAGKPTEFLKRNIARLPVAVQVEIANQAGCALFLAALRAYVDDAAPGMLRWENREFAGRTYVRIGAARPDRNQGWESIAIHYVATTDALTFTLDEDVLRAAITRANTREADPAKAAAQAKPWLGNQVGAHASIASAQVLATAAQLDGSGPDQRMRRACWANLPILNEWRTLLPDEDPVTVHERLFGVRLVCPGGGTYIWDADWMTMASTVHGHPGAPGKTAGLPAALSGLEAADAGLSFEHGGLRAVVELRERATSTPSALDRP